MLCASGVIGIENSVVDGLVSLLMMMCVNVYGNMEMVLVLMTRKMMTELSVWCGVE